MFNKALDISQVTGLFEGLENWGRGMPVLSPSLTGSSPNSIIFNYEQPPLAFLLPGYGKHGQG